MTNQRLLRAPLTIHTRDAELPHGAFHSLTKPGAFCREANTSPIPSAPPASAKQAKGRDSGGRTLLPPQLPPAAPSPGPGSLRGPPPGPKPGPGASPKLQNAVGRARPRSPAARDRAEGGEGAGGWGAEGRQLPPRTHRGPAAAAAVPGPSAARPAGSGPGRRARAAGGCSPRGACREL